MAVAVIAGDGLQVWVCVIIWMIADKQTRDQRSGRVTRINTQDRGRDEEMGTGET